MYTLIRPSLIDIKQLSEASWGGRIDCWIWKLLFSWILGEIDSTFSPKIYQIIFYRINLNLSKIQSDFLSVDKKTASVCTCQSQITFFTRDPTENNL